MSIGSDKFSRAGNAKDQAAELGTSLPTVYRWRKGTIPPREKQDKIFELYEIPPHEWLTGVLEVEAEAREAAEAERRAPAAEPVELSDPSPRGLWEDVHRWRKQLQRQKAPAREIAAAIASEREALKLLSGDATKYAELQKVTAAALVAFPEALEALQGAWARAGL